MKNITSIVIVFIALILLSGCNKTSSSERLVNAQQEYNNSNYPAVIIQLKNLIRDEPQNKEARALLAKSQYQLGNFLNAEKEFLKSIELGIELKEVSHYYINTLYAIDDHTGVIDFWENNTSSLTNVQKAEIAPVTSIAYLNQGRPQESYDTAQAGKSLALKLNDIELITVNSAVADTYNQPSKIEDTINTLTVACEAYPNRWVICDFLANSLFSANHFKEAAQVLETILENKPNHTKLVMKLADSYVRAENIAKAELYTNALLDKFPKQPYINLLAATIELKKENFNSALNYINSSINSGLINPQTKLIASLANYQLGNNEQAFYHLQGLRNAFPNNTLITKLYVAIQLRLGDSTSITDAYSTSKASEDNSEIFALASLELLKSGNSKESNDLLQLIDTSLIKNQKILNSVSLMKLAAGDNSGVIDLENSLNILVNKPGDKKEISKVKMLLISSLLANNDKEKALNYVNNWIINSPNEIENKILLIEIERKNKIINKNKIESTFSEIIKIAPDNIIANLHYGQKSYLNREFDAATEYFAKVINNNKFNLLAMQGYFYSQEELSSADQALTYLEGNFKNADSNAQEREALALLYLLTNRPSKTIKLLENTGDEKNTIKIGMILAEAYFQHKDYTKAIAIYEEQVNSQNMDRQIIAKLAIAYDKSGNVKAAIKTFEKLNLSSPDNTQIGLILANFHIFDNKQSESIAYIESLTVTEQSNPTVIGLKGKAYYFSNKYILALPLLEESYNQTSDSKLVPMIFNSKIKLKKDNEALSEMEKHLEAHPNEVVNRIYYANELIKHDKNKAISQYSKVIINDKSNILALNNLAWLLYEAGDISKAKKYIDRAMKIEPNNPDVIDTNNKINQAINR
jgi:putative PEP-CTERM system TPR-repeat lipoprotein